MTIVTFGEIMLRLSPPGFQRFVQARSLDVVYGGGEANVAASLAHYGLPVEYVTRLPANDIGDACLSYLRQYGVGTSYVVRGGGRLGIYFLGDMNLVTVAEVEKLMAGDASGRVSR